MAVTKERTRKKRPPSTGCGRKKATVDVICTAHGPFLENPSAPKGCPGCDAEENRPVLTPHELNDLFRVEGESERYLTEIDRAYAASQGAAQ